MSAMEFSQVLFLLLLSVVMVSSRSTRVKKLESKLWAVETSLSYDIQSMREELQSNSEQLATIISLLNGTYADIRTTENEQTGDVYTASIRSVEQTNDAMIRQELQRIRRAFSEEKLVIIREQSERYTELEELSKRIDNSMNELSDRIENQTDVTMNQMNDFIHKVESRMDLLLNTTNLGLNNTLKTMVDIVQRSVGEMNNGFEAGGRTPIATRDQVFGVTGHEIGENVLETQDGCNRKHSVDELVDTYGLVSMMRFFNIPILDGHLTIGSRTLRLRGQLELEYGKIRLANFSSFDLVACGGIGGRVQVFYNGAWGTVCDDAFDDRDASVICGMIGYRKGKAKTNAEFGWGTGLIWLDELDCTGNETSIFDCNGNNIGDHDCSHAEDAGVICSNE